MLSQNKIRIVGIKVTYSKLHNITSVIDCLSKILPWFKTENPVMQRTDIIFILRNFPPEIDGKSVP